MATIIEQKPVYKLSPVGQRMIFAVSNTNIVATYLNVKFIAEVHISDVPINLSTTNALIGTFKTTPNNVGVGIFDLSSILESYVKPRNLGTPGSEYKTTSYSEDNAFPIHTIDGCALGVDNIKFFAVQFKVEGKDGAWVGNPVEVISGQAVNSSEYLIFNGVVHYEDWLVNINGDYGLDLNPSGDNNILPQGNTSKFITNAPLVQDAELTDYGSFAFFNGGPIASATSWSDYVQYIIFTYYDNTGSSFGSDFFAPNAANGGANTFNYYAYRKLLYVGVFPANLDGNTTLHSTWAANKPNVAYYTVKLRTIGHNPATADYRINIKCPDLKGYEPIRLTWLNQWGAWDYYTFTKKSVRTTNTKRSTYTQLDGVWNKGKFRIRGYQGGKKNFRVNSKETIKINSDFLNEADAVWFEGLISSPEVYILKGYQNDQPPYTTTRRFVEPVLLKTSKFTRKTIANDKLIQYTFEVERNRDQRTQTS